jgi:hypothetical protein
VATSASDHEAVQLACQKPGERANLNLIIGDSAMDPVRDLIRHGAKDRGKY